MYLTRDHIHLSSLEPNVAAKKQENVNHFGELTSVGLHRGMHVWLHVHKFEHMVSKEKQRKFYCAR